MTQCEFCKEYLWNAEQTSCSGEACSSAYELAQEMGIELDEEREDD